MIGAIIEGIIYLIFHVIFEILFIGTGEIILYFITIGKRKPVWKRDFKESSAKLGILVDFSFIIGFIFWLSLTWLMFSKIF